MGEKILSPEPKARLLNWFQEPYKDAVAAARTCYSPKVAERGGLTAEQIERIGKGTFEGGHHTVFSHASFEFALENVSRQFVWSFLHSHPFYNSSQSSQRYVKLKEPAAAVPEMGEKKRKIFEETVAKAWEVYEKLTGMLLEDLKKKAGSEVDKKKERELEKKAMEIARYCLPVAAHTSLVHSVNGLTLYRLHKSVNSLDVGWEAKKVIGKMAEEVKKIDSKFFEGVGDPIPLEETPEFKALKEFGEVKTGEFIEEFDKELGERKSLLVSFTQNAEKVFGDSVRAVLGKTKKELEDGKAIELVLDPKKNSLLSETLNISTVSPLMRALNSVNFVFKKKISHSCDSQNQRHRMTPSARPLLLATVSEKPDYFTPFLIKRNTESLKVYEKWMDELWKKRNGLLKAGVKEADANYLLPNALNLRIIESGNLLNYLHKWRMRLCFNSQREIWETAAEELEQVMEKAPKLAEFVGPNCRARFRAGVKPFCPEGKRSCGKPVWAFERISPEKRPE